MSAEVDGPGAGGGEAEGLAAAGGETPPSVPEAGDAEQLPSAGDEELDGESPSAGSGDALAGAPATPDASVTTPEPTEEPVEQPVLGTVIGDRPAPEEVLAAVTPGPYAVATLVDGLTTSPSIGTRTLHYPTDAEAPFALVVVAPTRLSDESAILPWGTLLASHGMAVLTVGPLSVFDGVPASAMVEAVETLRAEQSRAGSPVAGKLATDRVALVGWSFAGTAALEVAAMEPMEPDLRAVVVLMANGQIDVSGHHVPSLFFEVSDELLGTDDAAVMYSQLPATTERMLCTVVGGTRDTVALPSGLEGGVGTSVLTFLKLFLEGDTRYEPSLSLATPVGATCEMAGF